MSTGNTSKRQAILEMAQIINEARERETQVKYGNNAITEVRKALEEVQSWVKKVIDYAPDINKIKYTLLKITDYIDVDDFMRRNTLLGFNAERLETKGDNFSIVTIESDCNYSVYIVLNKENVELVGDFSNIFSYLCFETIDLSSISLKIENAEDMFFGCELREVIWGEVDTSECTNMHGMFAVCGNLESLDLSSFDTSTCTNMGVMFSCCYGLTEIDLRNFNTSRVENMNNMFSYCNSLKSVDISNFDISKVKNMNKLFYECYRLESLNAPDEIKTADRTKAADKHKAADIFTGCSALKRI